jgi:hypothetical protein
MEIIIGSGVERDQWGDGFGYGEFYGYADEESYYSGGEFYSEFNDFIGWSCLYPHGNINGDSHYYRDIDGITIHYC